MVDYLRGTIFSKIPNTYYYNVLLYKESKGMISARIDLYKTRQQVTHKHEHVIVKQHFAAQVSSVAMPLLIGSLAFGGCPSWRHHNYRHKPS